MNRLIALTTACLLTAGAYAAATPAERLDEGLAQAKVLAGKQAYGDAAATIEKLNGDMDITAQTAWPDAAYLRARYLARAGQNEAALAAVEKAVQDGAAVSASDLENEADFAALRGLPRFQMVTGTLEKKERLWRDNPAIATPYKAVLSEEEKIAGLSKLWSEARFNFPFFGRIPEVDWDAAYLATLPQVRAAKTTEDYYRVLMRFVERLKDGHTRVLPPAELMDRFNGVTTVETRLVQGKIIVTGISDPALQAKGVRIGAEIVAIDGKPALEYAKTEVEPYVFGFTPQDRTVWQYGLQLLRGPVSQPVHLMLKDAKGKTFTADAPRVHNEGPFGILPKLAVNAQFKILPSNVAYLQINEFQDDAGLKTLKENFAAIAAADGLVIDIRENGGGNDDNSHDLVKVLADKPFRGSIWRTVDYKAAFRSWSRPIGWHRSDSAPTFQPDPTLHVATPVAVLIGPRTYSAAEDFLVSYISSGRGKLIGETTGGSTGNPMLIKLPGGGMAFICTKDDAFYDGRVFEGAGIAPDIEVKPTIADIRAGRDPALERAVSLLKQGR
jgi:carboxyl-terminal processing protease